MFIKYKKSNISATTRIHDITRETNEHLNLWSCVLFRLFWAHRPHHFSLNQCCLPHLHPRSGSVASKSFYSLFSVFCGRWRTRWTPEWGSSWWWWPAWFFLLSWGRGFSGVRWARPSGWRWHLVWRSSGKRGLQTGTGPGDRRTDDSL